VDDVAADVAGSLLLVAEVVQVERNPLSDRNQ
jgi:hypothetical protein